MSSVNKSWNALSLFLCLISVIATNVGCPQKPKILHKSAEEIRTMSPEQRFDEYVLQSEQCHSFEREDREKYGTDYCSFIGFEMRNDGEKLFRYFSEIANDYDPANSTKSEAKRMRIVWEIAHDIDNASVRLRASKEGNSLIASLDEEFERKKRHGDFTKQGYASFAQYAFYDLVIKQLEGTNPSPTDEQIRASLKKDYKINLTEEEMKTFINFLISTDPEYPRNCRYSTPVGCKDARGYFEKFQKFKTTN